MSKKHKLNARDARMYFTDRGVQPTKAKMERYLAANGPITHITCATCHNEKTIRAYHKNSKSILGLNPNCKVCTHGRAREMANRREKKTMNAYGCSTHQENDAIMEAWTEAFKKCGRTYGPIVPKSERKITGPGPAYS